MSLNHKTMKATNKMKAKEEIENILCDVEKAIFTLEYALDDTPPGYGTRAFRAAIKIFIHVLLDQMWKMQEAEKMDMEDRVKMGQAAGEDFNLLVRKYTGQNSRKMYKPE